MKKLSMGVLVSALLLSAAMGGVSFGGGSGRAITQPEVIELSVPLCGNESCRFFPLRDLAGRRTGQVTLAKDPLFDVDGTKVGNMNASCVVSGGRGGGTNWVCTYVLGLKAGTHTERGTVVTTGIYASPGPTDVFAVTGGTGAYENVRGYATYQERSGRDSYVLHLIP